MDSLTPVTFHDVDSVEMDFVEGTGELEVIINLACGVDIPIYKEYPDGIFDYLISEGVVKYNGKTNNYEWDIKELANNA